MRKFGSKGSAPGQFAQPEQIALDREGNILVADTDNRRVQIFKQDGTFITVFNTNIDEHTHESGGYTGGWPRCVCVDADGRILVGDSNCVIRVFAFE